MKYDSMVYFRFGKKDKFFVQRTQQLGLIIALQDLTGVLVKSDDQRLKPLSSGIIYNLFDQKLMATVHTIEKADSGDTGFHRLQMMIIV
jgi:hypothetical protein